jgi:hypothetical protein
MERAIQRTKKKNATSKTTSSSCSKAEGKKSLPGTPPLSDFTTLQSASVDVLAKIAQESCIIFTSTAGSPAKLIHMIQARELAQAELAKTRYKIEQEKELAKEKAVAAQVEPVTGTGETSAAEADHQQVTNDVGVKRPAVATKKPKKVVTQVGHRPLTRRARALGLVPQ